MAVAVNEFAGFRAFVERLDRAVGRDCEHSIARCLQDTLCELVHDDEVQLPEMVFQPHPDHYARRELYTSEELGYSVVAMTWGPGQGTAVHDHCGMWCVESVWSGEIEVAQYKLVEQDGERYRFEKQPDIQAGTGTAGSLIPPHEYHSIANVSEHTPAVTVHIYRGTMKRCNVFKPLGDGWYERCPRQLCLDQ